MGRKDYCKWESADFEHACQIYIHPNFLDQQTFYRMRLWMFDSGGIPAFIELGQALECDMIRLTSLRRWYQTGQAFDARDVTRPDHPDAEEFRKILADPLLQAPNVNAGQLLNASEHHGRFDR